MVTQIEKTFFSILRIDRRLNLIKKMKQIGADCQLVWVKVDDAGVIF